jgi:hypothetical protein
MKLPSTKKIIARFTPLESHAENVLILVSGAFTGLNLAKVIAASRWIAAKKSVLAIAGLTIIEPSQGWPNKVWGGETWRCSFYEITTEALRRGGLKPSVSVVRF